MHIPSYVFQAAVAVLCATLEAWILVYVNYIPESRMCGEQGYDEQISFRLQLFEIGWTYFFPVLVITVLDARVRLVNPDLSRLCIPNSCDPPCFRSYSVGRSGSTDWQLGTALEPVSNARHKRQRLSLSITIENDARKRRSRFKIRIPCLKVLLRVLGTYSMHLSIAFCKLLPSPILIWSH